MQWAADVGPEYDSRPGGDDIFDAARG